VHLHCAKTKRSLAVSPKTKNADDQGLIYLVFLWHTPCNGYIERRGSSAIFAMITASTPQTIVRVVVIEDNEDDRDLLVRQLRKSRVDNNVKFLSDGKEALNFLANLPPPSPFCDLIAIFLDLKLPGINGVDLLREIRKTPRVQNIPVIIMTSSLDPKDFEACQDLKVSAFIPKPVTFDLFSKAITGVSHMPASLSGTLPSHHWEE
jgi:CheY-like chemotaxis protein